MLLDRCTKNLVAVFHITYFDTTIIGFIYLLYVRKRATIGPDLACELQLPVFGLDIDCYREQP